MMRLDKKDREAFAVEFPIFRHEEKKFLEFFVSAVRTEHNNLEELRSYIQQLVGEHFSPHLKNEDGNRFASCILSIMEMGGKQTLTLTLNGRSLDVRGENELMNYINSKIRAVSVLERVAKFLVTETTDCYHLLMAAHMTCLFLVVAQLPIFNPELQIKASDTWNTIDYALEALYELKLGWNEQGKIFEADSSILGKLCDNLKGGRQYTLVSHNSKWLVVKLGELEKELSKVFPWAEDTKRGLELGVLNTKYWLDPRKEEIFLERPQVSHVKEQKSYLFISYYRELPNLFNLYVHYALRKSFTKMAKASDLLATTNVVITIKKEHKIEQQELDILLMDIFDRSIGIVECTISGSTEKLTEKKQKINEVKYELENSGLNVKVADVVTPSPTLKEKIREIANKFS